jgi:hypothetical protein
MPLVPDYPQRMAGALRVCAAGNLVYVLRVRFENSKNLKIEKTIKNSKNRNNVKNYCILIF